MPSDSPQTSAASWATPPLLKRQTLLRPMASIGGSRSHSPCFTSLSGALGLLWPPLSVVAWWKWDFRESGGRMTPPIKRGRSPLLLAQGARMAGIPLHPHSPRRQEHTAGAHDAQASCAGAPRSAHTLPRVLCSSPTHKRRRRPFSAQSGGSMAWRISRRKPFSAPTLSRRCIKSSRPSTVCAPFAVLRRCPAAPKARSAAGLGRVRPLVPPRT